MTDTTADARWRLLPVASPRQTLCATRQLLTGHRFTALSAVVALLLASAAGLVVPMAIGWIVDVVTGTRPAGMFTVAIVALFVAALVQAGLTRTGGVLVARALEPALAQLREGVLGRALRLPTTRIEQAGSGDVVSRVTGDIEHVSDAAQDALAAFVSALLTILLTIGGLAVLDVRFGLAALCAVPIQLHTLRWYLRRSSPLYAAHRRAEGERSGQLLESTGAAATVRAFGLADRHVAAVRDRSQRAVDYQLATVRVLTRFFGRLNVAEFVGLAAVLLVGYLLVARDEVTLGAAAAAALYFSRLFDPINTVLSLFDTVQQAGASLTRLVGLWNAPVPPEPAVGRRPAGADLRVQRLEAGYGPGREVLHGIDLTVSAGQRIALVGSSGAGKTTLARAIAGLHAPDRGGVLVGGVPLAEMCDAAIRDAVVLLSQETHIFAGTLAEDLRLAAPDATDQRLRWALAEAEATEWVAGLPDGIDTRVGTGGRSLTPAQEQQIALARLALRDPPIAVLDEATAEAGSAAADRLERAAARVLAGRTAVIVTHRLAQAAAADRIVVIADGRIVEQGSHERLLAAGGGYAELWRAWSPGARC